MDRRDSESTRSGRSGGVTPGGVTPGAAGLPGCPIGKPVGPTRGVAGFAAAPPAGIDLADSVAESLDASAGSNQRSGVGAAPPSRPHVARAQSVWGPGAGV
jgi:hypothetical protein